MERAPAMPAWSPPYVLGHSEAELDRLISQGRLLDDLTEYVLREAGLRPGMSVLDAGCGTGDVSLLAARLVGEEGKVVGVDRSSEAVAVATRRANGLSNVTFIEHDLSDLTLLHTVDALVGRLVLMYFPDPAATLRRLVDSVRPGGLVLFQEIDPEGARSEPYCRVYETTVGLIKETFRRSGVDLRTSLKLRGILEGAGLRAPQMIQLGKVEGGAHSPAYAYVADMARTMLPLMEQVGVATAEDLEVETLARRMREEALAKNATLALPPLIAAWARKEPRGRSRVGALGSGARAEGGEGRGAMKRGSERTGETAVVIGASIGGLLAARVASETYREVVIVERDALPVSAEQRKGVPQGRHAHALLAKGQEVLECLFPGLTEGLVRQGAPHGFGRFHVGGGYLCLDGDTPGALFVSRPALEVEVRRRLLARPNVRILEQHRVSGLVTGDEPGRITGVRVRRSGEAGGDEVLSTDLVIDASGRGSQTPAWLASFGYVKPREELVEVRMGYASRLYERRPEHLDGDLIANVAPTRANKRGCGMLAQEGDRWMVTLGGYFGDHPPTDEAGFLEFARTLAVPDVYEVISAAEALTDPVPYRFPANKRRRYEKLGRFPEGLLVFGDAICSFTPIYGQGMTVAALEALALRDCLAAGRRSLARRFFRRASRIVDMAWVVTAGGDSSLFDDQTKVPSSTRLLNWYVGKLQIVARRDPVVALAFMRVANLVEPPTGLLRPRIAARVLWGSLGSGDARGATLAREPGVREVEPMVRSSAAGA